LNVIFVKGYTIIQRQKELQRKIPAFADMFCSNRGMIFGKYKKEKGRKLNPLSRV
jgi:hypothetical protein